MYIRARARAYLFRTILVDVLQFPVARHVLHNYTVSFVCSREKERQRSEKADNCSLYKLLCSRVFSLLLILKS